METLGQNTKLRQEVSLTTVHVVHRGFMKGFLINDYFLFSKVSNLENLEQNLASAKETASVLEQKIEQDKVGACV